MMPTKAITQSLTLLIIWTVITGCNKQTQTDERPQPVDQVALKDFKDQAWHMEELYWQHVQNNDTAAYKKLWHDDFIGYPSFGDGTAGKSKIAVWIPELHADTSRTFSYKLYKKAVNAIDDVVIVFYDADEIWTDRDNQVVKVVTTKFTHTWKKYGDTWLILGGMAAEKGNH